MEQNTLPQEGKLPAIYIWGAENWKLQITSQSHIFWSSELRCQAGEGATAFLILFIYKDHRFWGGQEYLFPPCFHVEGLCAGSAAQPLWGGVNRSKTYIKLNWTITAGMCLAEWLHELIAVLSLPLLVVSLLLIHDLPDYRLLRAVSASLPISEKHLLLLLGAQE